MIEIDGSFGEGGGQIVRSSLALSAITGKAVRLTNVRAGRKRPGLQRQHLVAVQAAAKVCNAQLEGDTLGSTQIVFVPGDIAGGYFDLPIGTAGSTALVMQTVLLPLLLAPDPSTLQLGGGTHNPLAPTFEFLRDTYLPRLRDMGGTVDARLYNAGYYPVGGGRVQVNIAGNAELKGIELLERGDRQHAHALIRLARLPDHIAERQARTLRRALNWPDLEIEIDHQRDAQGPGNAVVLTCRYEHATQVFSAIGERRKSAEQVAEEAAEQARTYEAADAPVDEYLADQLMLPLALAGYGRYRAACVSLHTRTHAELIRRFLDVRIELSEGRAGGAEITIG